MLRVVELLNAFGQWLVAHLGRMSIELAILAVVVLAAIWLLRVKSPKFRHLFWCLVLAKPVATFLIASPLSLYWFLRPEPEEPPPPAPVVVSQAPTIQARPLMTYRPEHRYPTIPMEVPKPVPVWRQVGKEGAASLAWLVIATIFGVRLVIGCAYVGFLRQSAERQRGGALADIVSEASRALGVRRRVTVALSSVAHGPVLAGVFRPVILIPRTMAEALSAEQLKMVITHEVAHARRWDNLVLLIQRLAEMFLFFHPVVWFCGWIMRREAEAACDDAVVDAYGDWADGQAAAAYADSLTRVAEMKCGLTRRLLVNTFAAAESNFNRRVRRLLTGKAGRMTLGLSALSMAALVVIACVGLPTAAVRKAEKEGEMRVLLEDVVSAFDDLLEADKEDDLCQQDDMFAHLVCTRAAGWDDVDYSDVMAISGSSAMFAYEPKQAAWPGPVAPPGAEDRIARATGFGWERLHFETAEEAWQALKVTLDDGNPARAPYLEELVLAGYEEAPNKRDRKVFVLGAYYAHPGEWWTWEWFTKWFDEHGKTLGRHTERSDAAPVRETALSVMENLVLWSDRPPMADDPKLAGVQFGFWGLDAYVRDLADSDKTLWNKDNSNKDTYDIDLPWACYWVYPQFTARECTARYLERVADAFVSSPGSRSQITSAAEHYHATYGDWLKWEKLVGRKATPSISAAWADSAIRGAAADHIREAMSHERAAVAALAAVLRGEGTNAAATASSEPRPSKAASPGLHWPKPRMDTFAMTMARVAEFLGARTDYRTIQVLSGEAFAPGIDPGESCPGKWNRRGADLALPPIADALGLSIEAIPLPPRPGWQGDWDKTKAAWAEHRKQVAPLLRKALDSDAVILTDGGWDYRPPEFPNAYTYWGVITEALDDGTILGAVFTNGRHDNPIGFLQNCWAVKPGEPGITPQETRIEALKLGLARIRQNAEPFLEDERVFGLAAMDAWAERFKHVPFCGDDCGPKAPGCPLSNASTMCEAARNAAAYLRANEESFHESVRPSLREAAGQYARIAEALAPFTKWEGGYEPIMGDAEKQKAHIAVIRSCRDALAAAGDALAAALEGQGVPVANAEAPLKPKGTALMLEDFPAGPGRSNTFAAGMASIVKWWGTDGDYDTIMGDSGLAFIIQGDAKGSLIDGALDLGWWPLDPWGFVLRVDFLAQTLGHELRFTQADLDEWRADPAAYYQKHWEQDVRASLERGQAVLAEGITWSLILGMDDGDPPLLGRCAAADKADVTRFDAYPWALVLVGGATDPLDRRKADIHALEHAVALGRDTIPLPDGKSAGQKTYALWAAALRDTEHIGQARWHQNVLGHLGTSRESAVSYLRAMATRHPGAVARHLNAAADCYGKVLAELKKEDFTGEKMVSREGREELARYVEGLAALDARAVDEMAWAFKKAKPTFHSYDINGDGVKERVPFYERGSEPSPAVSLQEYHLLQWQNIFGRSLDECRKGAEQNPEVNELVDLAVSLEPISEDARILREEMTRLEPADLVYWERLEGIVKAIGSDGLDGTQKNDGKLLFEFPAWEDRQVRIAKCARALELWREGVWRRKARNDEATDSATVDEVYELLGRRNRTKERLVDLTLVKLKTGEVRGDDLESLRVDKKLGEFVHRIEMLDATLWSFENNYRLLLRSIGQGKAIGEWHKPDGPLAWSDGNPEDELRVEIARGVLDVWLGQTASDTLETWLNGPDQLDENGRSDPAVAALKGLRRSLYTALGERGTCPEKEWLARCLLVYLRDHRANYYAWRMPTYSYDINGDGIEEEVPFFSATAFPLPSEEEPVVKREGERVVIENVPRPWGSCSSLATLTALLQHRGEDARYTYLMGASSRAFRLQFSWCPSAPHAYVGFNVFEPALKAVGYDRTQLAGQFVMHDGDHREATDEDREQTRAAVRAAIDAGETVIFGSEEDALLVGYEPISDANPTGWLCRPGPLGGPPPEDEPYVNPVEKLPWGFCTLKKVSDPLPRQQAALWAIKTAVVNAERGTVEGQDLKTGFAAWQMWIDELGDFDAVVKRTAAELKAAGREEEDPLFSLQLGNAWTYENLVFARYEAANYLDDIAPDMPEDARAHLERASDEYGKTAGALVTEDESCFEIAPYPWAEQGKDWNDAMRKRQAKLLRKALRHERTAVDALKAALDAMDVEVPVASAESAASARAAASTSLKQLENYRWKPMWNSHVACLKAAADEVGVDVSVPWIYGATGYAFLINVHEAMCPSGWHVVDAPVKERMAGAGLDVEYLTDPVHAFDRKEELQQQAWSGVRKAIDAGLPCYGYDLEVGDYYSVYGYDDVGYYYAGPQCEDGKGPLPWRDYGVTNMVGIIYMLSVDKGSPGDDVAVVRNALTLALKQAEEAVGADENYQCGLAGYDQWIQSFESGKADGFGTSYNAQCYAEARRNAVEFLKEAEARLEGKTDADFGAAIAQYEEAARSLQIVAEAFPFFDRKPEHIEDKKRVASAIEALKAAKAAEEKGLRALVQLAKSLGAEEVDMPTNETRPVTNGSTARTTLEGIEAGPRHVSHMACIEGCLQFLGRDVSPAWLYGATGYAFGLCVHPQLCPSAPFAWEGGRANALGRNLGYAVETVSSDVGQPDKDDKRQQAWALAQEAIAAGQPCYSLDIAKGEFFILSGVDDTGYYWRDWTEGNAVHGPVPWESLGTTGIAGRINMNTVRPVEPAADAKVVEAALRDVLERQKEAAAAPDDAGYLSGVRAYDRWIRAFEADDTELIQPWYTARFWAECRGHAVDFLKEAKERLNDEERDALFDQAAEHYQVVADNLARVAELLPEQDARKVRIEDKAVRHEIAEALTLARDAERQGLRVLGQLAGEDATKLAQVF